MRLASYGVAKEVRVCLSLGMGARIAGSSRDGDRGSGRMIVTSRMLLQSSLLVEGHAHEGASDSPV